MQNENRTSQYESFEAHEEQRNTNRPHSIIVAIFAPISTVDFLIHNRVDSLAAANDNSKDLLLKEDTSLDRY